MEDVAKAVEALGGLGDPRALAVLQALDAEQLRVDPQGGVYIQDGATLRDAVTGHPATPTGVDSPIVNNAIRRALEPALSVAASHLAGRRGPEGPPPTTSRSGLPRTMVPALKKALADGEGQATFG